ncbi:MAG: 3-methyl-2-oxobutanoate hydroxymethyltransferase [Chloroflexota bacterium]
MSAQSTADRKKITTHTFRQRKEHGEPITMLTAYDYPTALAADRAGIDSLLVGDSLGMVVLGYENTLSVTMDDMLHHCKAVARGAKVPLLIGDMPFMSYQVSTTEAVRNAGRFLAEAGMDAVKLEGGREMAATIEAIVKVGIPMCGHIGLTPQSIHKLGGYKAQGRNAHAARRLIEDALILEEAGCFAIVLEAVPDRVAELISRRLAIPTIGIGAGAACDGQVLVTHDLLGLFDRFTPKFVKKYADVHGEMMRAFGDYKQDVIAHRFPTEAHTYSIPADEWETLLADLEAEPVMN